MEGSLGREAEKDVCVVLGQFSVLWRQDLLRMSGVGGCVVGLSSKVEFQKSRHVDPAAKHRDGGLAVPGSKDKLVSSPSQ